MVDFIKTWGTALISAAVIGCICNILLPRHSIAKAARILVGLYLAVAVFVPFLNADFQLPSELPVSYVPAGTSQTAADEAVLKETTFILREKIVAQLLRENVQVLDIAPVINIAQNGGIYCDEITVILDKGYQDADEKIRSSIRELCGVEPTLMYR